MLKKYCEINYEYDVREIILDYLNFVKTNETEIEIRLGRIVEKSKKERIKLQTNHYVIIDNSSSKYCFISGVKSSAYENINKKFDKYEKKEIEDRVEIDGNVRNVYQNGKLQYSMIKEKERFIDIYCPKNEYDIRLSISNEKPVNFRPSSATKKFYRERKRESYKIGSYLFEFTKVLQEKNVIYEIEMEVVDNEYEKNEFISAFLNIQKE